MRIFIIFLLVTFYTLINAQVEKNYSLNKIEINDNWKLYNEAKSILVNNVSFPNSIHEILFKKNIIPDPYYANNETNLKWIEETNWIAEKEIFIDSVSFNTDIFLNFYGIESYSLVFLNDKFVGESNNSFVPLKIKINSFLHHGSMNKIKILFNSPVLQAKKKQEQSSIKLPGDERVYVRKPQYEFGWDWGPRFVSTGVKKIIELEYVFISSINVNAIKYQIHTLNTQKATITFNANIATNKNQIIFLELNPDTIVTKPIIKKIKLRKGLNRIAFNFDIQNPILWWPVNMGIPYSYDFNLKIKNKLKEVLYKHSLKFPICKIDLIQDNDSIGKSFYFKVNSTKIYAKGFNIIPGDHFNSNYNLSHIAENVAMCNGNMIRIWGGGPSFPIEFYNSCVDNGILIWQDFRFACAMYPGDSAFINNVKNEVLYEAERLGNFNNIALWCGNNENDEGWKNWGWQKSFNYSINDSVKIYNNYINLFQNSIPNQLKKNLPNCNYIHTSPMHGWGRKESLTEGDSHYWGVWWGKEPIEIFKAKIPRFMSEFGMQAMPEISTYEKCMAKNQIHFDSLAFKNHQKHPTGYETINNYLSKYLLIPQNINQYAYATQVLQALTLKTAIESQRMSKNRCNGSLIWQLNDSWPVTSWSVIDYYQNKKLAYHEIKHAFNTNLITMKEDSLCYYFSLISDETENKSAVLVFSVCDFYEKVIFKDSVLINISPFSNNIIYTLPKNKITEFPLSKIFINAKCTAINCESNFYLVPLKELVFPVPKLNITKEILDNEYLKITLRSSVVCPFFKINNQNQIFEEYNISEYTAFNVPNYISPSHPVVFYAKNITGTEFEKIKQTIIENIQCLNLLLH